MSCNEWERGEWNLSCAEYPKFCRSLVEAFNKLQVARLNRALAIHKQVMEANKGKHNVNWWQEIEAAMTKAEKVWSCGLYIEQRDRYDLGIMKSMMKDKVLLTDDELKQRYPYQNDWEKYKGQTEYVDRQRPRLPKKNDFPLANRKAKAFNVGGEASIRLNDEKRMVFWNVEENNHACDTAREQPLAQDFFRILKTVNWTRGTGGQIIGNDEYNEDSGRDYEGGGGSYNKGTWGPKEEKTPVHQYQF